MSMDDVDDEDDDGISYSVNEEDVFFLLDLFDAIFFFLFGTNKDRLVTVWGAGADDIYVYDKKTKL